MDMAQKVSAETAPGTTPGATPDTTNVLIVGVGGQGVIMVSRVMARIGQLQGFDVKQSEVHGMAKRGGVVFSHVRFGPTVWSPTIPRGKADILLALEWAEGLRWLNYLKKGSGTFIADTRHIVPPFACLDRTRGAKLGYLAEPPGVVLDQVADGYALDATALASALGNHRVSNTVLLGTLSVVIGFAPEIWQKAIAEMVPPRTVEVNLKAFEAGRRWAAAARENPESAREHTLRKPAVLPELEARDFELRITPEWCKGCDICVKMCPERCLSLNALNIVELTEPDRCTGCRICEWLCPDFAIDVIKTLPETASR
ncbi:MAG: 2-oxoacid:acceptor oxidoreductase family protein [Proteobacteria bacterium]|nr:2-oxoacid:acceptor oxidoreductase family protein [Pseudomonadota bacterium]MCH8950612.1 2-oxoacid:acceptor oxidoreductase family protein [Pseudomonadota bacterium]